MHALAKDYGTRMKFEVVKHAEGDSPQRIAAFGLNVHGMVIADQDKNKLWAESGHQQKREAVEAEIEKLLGG